MSRKLVKVSISVGAILAIASLHAQEADNAPGEKNSTEPNAEYAKNVQGMEAPAPVVRRNLVKTAMTDEKILWRPLIDSYKSMHLRITGPGIEPYDTTFSEGEEIAFGFYDEESTIWSNGLYKWELTASPKLSERNNDLLEAARNETGVDNIEDVLRANGVVPPIPAGQSMTQSGTFRIYDGQPVRLQTEFQRRVQDQRAASAEAAGFPGDRDLTSGVQLRDSVTNDDKICIGSICVGFDCVNGEAFGFDTIKLKENNLRIKFDDTSSTASFPRRDWQILVNDSSNGGLERFSIEDITGGRIPFTIEGNAPANALYLDDGGRLGLGTSSPVVDLQVVSGNTPTLRLEQNGTSGFTPQTWDVAGNETNFFIRDATGGSTLPFRIRPGAPSTSIDIRNDGDIGLGTASPDARLHIDTNGGEDSFLISNDGTSGSTQFIVNENGKVGIGIDDPATNSGSTDLALNKRNGTGYKIHLTGAPPGQFHLISADNANGGGGNARLDIQATNINMNLNVDADISMVAGTSTGDVGIGTTGPGFKLEVNGTAGKPGGGSWSVASDERLKKNIQQLDGALDKLTSLRGVTYEYKDPEAIRQLPGQRIGLIAQEVEQVFPDWIDEGKDGFKRLTVRGFEAIAANAMRELRAEKDAEIAALREKTEKLEAQMKLLLERMEDSPPED